MLDTAGDQTSSGAGPGDAVMAGPRIWGRGRDRRESVGDLLVGLTRHLRAARDRHSLVARLEAALRDLLHFDRVEVRESSEPYLVQPAPSGPDCIRVEVPARGSPSRVVLEARPGRAGLLDAWASQQLALAAHLAALILEIDRHRAAPRGARDVGPVGDSPALIGSSPAMSDLRRQIARVAATDFTVLVQGESGTGKELVARQIHESSPRRLGPFIAVNCAALVESLLEAELFGIEDRTATGVRGRRGKFELADGGTLFLDEVSDLAPAAQAKLLRVVQELTVERVGGHASRRVDTRIIVATNRSLRDLAARGAFREDLYYRLSGVEVHVPPLRLRKADVTELAEHFLGRYSAPRRLVLSPAVLEVLQAYDWPGNVRELERVIEGAVTVSQFERVTLDDLPPSVRGDYLEVLQPSLARDDTMRAWGSRYARLVLERCGGNKRQASKLLDISYHTLQAYLRYQPGSRQRPAPEGFLGEAPNEPGREGEPRLPAGPGPLACLKVRPSGPPLVEGKPKADGPSRPRHGEVQVGI
jgi:DNA-binding NtrC family response regulator